jgi:Ca-activated chloride channel family protein
MTTPEIVIMTDAEIDRLISSDEEKGYGALLTAEGPLPLKALDVQAKIDGLIVETSLTQCFVNTHKEPLEATYIFPLPDRAAVTRFQLEVAGRLVDGVLQERAEARKIYDEAIQAGHRAAITEEERPGVFTMRVGNLPPGELATVRLTLVGPLIYDDGEVTFRFPLVVAPRYIPGIPLEGPSAGDGFAVDTSAVPDASRISPPVLLPGYPYPVRFSLAVDVAGIGLPVEGFRSSLHAVTTAAIGGAMRIAVDPGDRLDRDFILRYRLGDNATATSLTLVPDADASSREGTFMLTVVPPATGGQANRGRPRQVVFVLDRSGSMAGWKMVAARRALGRMIDSLTDRDRFTVYAFDDALEVPPPADGGLLPATDRNRFRAIEWLATIDARGGTEMAQPLDQAVTQLNERGQGTDEERVLVLLTDGQVGNEDQILQVLGKRLKGIRVFTLGVDQAVNEAFLKRFAALGGGSCDVVESEDRLDEIMDKVQRRIGTPLWTGVRTEATGLQIEAATLVPGRLPDLFAGVPLMVLGRYRGAAAGKITVQATDEAGQPVQRTVEARTGSGAAVAQVWARGRLRDLEDRWVVGDSESPADLEKEMVGLSLKYGVLCRFTAYVVVDHSEVVNQGGQQQRLIQPVEPAAGWEMLKAPVRTFPSKALLGDVSAKYKCMQRPEMRMSEQDESFEDSLYSSVMDMDYEFEEQVASASAPMDCDDSTDQGMEILQRPIEDLRERIQQELDGGTDLFAAYRQRARDLLEELQAATDKQRALGVLAVKLKALLEDMQSIGIDSKELEPLRQLLADLEPNKAAPPQLAGNLSQLAAQAEKVLATFANIEASRK